jgi:hypothetical protein
MEGQLLGQALGEPENPAHALMTEIGRTTVHHGATTGNHGYPQFPAKLRGSFGNTAASKRPVHPNAGNARLRTLLDNFLALLRPRDDENGIYAAGNGSNVGIATDSLNRFRIGIDGKDFVAKLAELPKDAVGRFAFAVPTDTGYRDTLLGQEVVYPFLYVTHYRLSFDPS